MGRVLVFEAADWAGIKGLDTHRVTGLWWVGMRGIYGWCGRFADGWFLRKLIGKQLPGVVAVTGTMGGWQERFLYGSMTTEDNVDEHD